MGFPLLSCHSAHFSWVTRHAVREASLQAQLSLREATEHWRADGGIAGRQPVSLPRSSGRDDDVRTGRGQPGGAGPCLTQGCSAPQHSSLSWSPSLAQTPPAEGHCQRRLP